MITDAAARAYSEGRLHTPPRTCTVRPESDYEMELPPLPAECPFCERIRAGEYGYASAPSYARDPHVVAFQPLNPVTPGHLLVVPSWHVEHALENPDVTAETMKFAAEIARRLPLDSCNLITSAGAAATQTVRHLHIHLVPRREGDGLSLPWTG